MKLHFISLLMMFSAFAQERPTFEEIQKIRAREEENRSWQGCPKGGCVSGRYKLVAANMIKYEKSNTDQSYYFFEGSKNHGKFTLKKQSGNDTKNMHFSVTPHGLVLIYEIDNHTDGSSAIEAVNPKTLKYKWGHNIGGFNLGTPLLKGKHVYVNSIGFVGKLDMEKGEFVWKHDNLYEKFKYNGAGRASLNKAKVSFIADGVVVEVDDKTGKILYPRNTEAKKSP